jgi:DNA-binding transcriptional MerR regulator
MSNKLNKDAKRYYTIGEVADLFGVSKSLIRYWEGEFDSLKPHKNSKGDRRFTQANLEQLKLIHELVKEKGFTLEGAKREIKLYKARLKQKQQITDKLNELRSFLVKLRDSI